MLVCYFILFSLSFLSFFSVFVLHIQRKKGHKKVINSSFDSLSWMLNMFQKFTTDNELIIDGSFLFYLFTNSTLLLMFFYYKNIFCKFQFLQHNIQVMNKEDDEFSFFIFHTIQMTQMDGKIIEARFRGFISFGGFEMLRECCCLSSFFIIKKLNSYTNSLHNKKRRNIKKKK